MLSFLLRRLLQAVAVLLTVSFMAFSLFQFVGDPVSNMVGQDASPEVRSQLRAELGLNRSVPVQFAHFVAHAAKGDFGLSLRQGRKVSALLAERFPATMELAGVAALLSLVLGVPLGIYAALARGRPLAEALMALSLVGVSAPTFLLGIVFIWLFSVTLPWLPSFGRGDIVAIGGWTTGLLTSDGWRHLLMPAVTLALYQVTLILRLVRSEMLEVLRADFIKFARARGLSRSTVILGHALTNTLVPVITVVALQLGGLIAFSIITETVFEWPGMGLLFVQAVQFADIPVMAAYLCLVALVFVALNLMADLLYLAVDPRLRAGSATLNGR